MSLSDHYNSLNLMELESAGGLHGSPLGEQLRNSFSGLQGAFSSAAQQGQARMYGGSRPSLGDLQRSFSVTSKPRTIRAELQDEISEWLKDD